MFKIDAPPSSVIGGGPASMNVVDVAPVHDPHHTSGIAVEEAPQQVKTPVAKTPQHPARYYSSVRLYPGVGSAPMTPSIDPAAVERLTYIVESQQANTSDMLTKLYQMHQEQLQQQTQQAQQLNASLQALLGESERYFHEVVQINQQLVGQLRDLFAATVQGALEGLHACRARLAHAPQTPRPSAASLRLPRASRRRLPPIIECMLGVDNERGNDAPLLTAHVRRLAPPVRLRAARPRRRRRGWLCQHRQRDHARARAHAQRPRRLPHRRRRRHSRLRQRTCLDINQ